MDKKYLSDGGLEYLSKYLQTDDVTLERASDGSLKLSTGQTVWFGHRADWEALSPTEKAKYGIVIFDDDGTTITVDSALSTTSENPVQNKVITVELNKKVDTEDLATVATSGSYNDLSNKPIIPTKTSDLTNDSDFVESTDLASVATSGDYDDLINKPTIPTVGNGTITIQKNSTDVDSFTTNQNSNKSINITVPTKTSELTNDSNFVESTDLSAVATSGSYNDLSNKPTIPTVNNGTLTIQKNGTAVETFTANSSTNKTANITVPTKTSDLTNDSDFVASTDLATVATSGSYNDLSNKPTIDSALSSTSTNAVQNKVIKSSLDGKASTSDAIKNITRNGTTFTATRADNTTFTFTQQDNNTTTGTTYTAGNVPANTTFGTNGSIKNAYDGLNSNKQPKTLATPLTLGGVQYTTVESFLGAVKNIVQATSYWNGGA